MLDKSQAVEKVKQRISQIPALANKPRFSPEFQTWHRDTRVLIAKIFGVESHHVADFTVIDYSYRGIVTNTTPDHVFENRFRQQLDTARAVMESIVHEIEEFGIESEEPHIDAVKLLTQLFERFQLVSRQLRQRHASRPTLEVEDEYDVQDLLHALLHLYFQDVRAEEWTPSYVGKASRMDFLLKNEQLVVETKKSRKGLAEKEIGDELLIDIARYRAHPDCKTLLCFVYDPEMRIANPRGIENDLSKKDGTLDVIVKIVP